MTAEIKSPIAIASTQEILDAVQTDSEPEQDHNAWSINQLAEHIESKHHKSAAEKMPQILANLNKICLEHGTKHPELLEIRDLFRDIAHELTIHMKREEYMIFPVIKKMVSARSQHRNIPSQTYGTIQNPIAVMMQEHENVGEWMQRIAVLSNGYSPASDACITHRASFSMLKEFEDDLHKHIHLENNILFPKAVLLEKELQVAFN